MIPGFPLGTDGWRGILADGCTFESVRRVCAAAASVYARLPEGTRGGSSSGMTRASARPELARAAAEVFARGGISVLLADRPIPTPAVSYHVRRLGLAGGLAITASHNPAHYNGVKIKTRFGSSASPELYEAVARAADGPPAEAPRAGRIEVVDLLSPYRDHLASLVRLDTIASAGLCRGRRLDARRGRHAPRGDPLRRIHARRCPAPGAGRALRGRPPGADRAEPRGGLGGRCPGRVRSRGRAGRRRGPARGARPARPLRVSPPGARAPAPPRLSPARPLGRHRQDLLDVSPDRPRRLRSRREALTRRRSGSSTSPS